MRQIVFAFGLLAACAPAPTPPPVQAEKSQMSCAQLLRLRAALEREAAFFPSRGGSDVVSQAPDFLGSYMRGYNGAVMSRANAAQAQRLSHAAELRRNYRAVNAEIAARGC